MLNVTPRARRKSEPGSGTAAAGPRKSVALSTLPTTPEKLPVSRREIWFVEKSVSGMEIFIVLGVAPPGPST